MKKYISLFLCLLFVFSFTSCNTTKDNAEITTNPESTTNTTQESKPDWINENLGIEFKANDGFTIHENTYSSISTDTSEYSKLKLELIAGDSENEYIISVFTVKNTDLSKENLIKLFKTPAQHVEINSIDESVEKIANKEFDVLTVNKTQASVAVINQAYIYETVDGTIVAICFVYPENNSEVKNEMLSMFQFI